MASARRWYERVLGALLLAFGFLFFVLAAIVAYVWSGHMYTVGLSVTSAGLTKMVAVWAIFALVAALGGVSLIRRP
jgi:predicted phage tail protein